MPPQDPHAVNRRQHEPRVPGAQADEAKPDHPGKPFRTPNKTKTHPAPDVATDGHHSPLEKNSGKVPKDKGSKG